MAIKVLTFEQEDLPGVDPITLELDYSYYHLAAKLDGAPEDCYPEEEESEINLPKNYEMQIMAAYAAAGREAIKAVEARCEKLRNEGKPAEWYREEDDNGLRGMIDGFFKLRKAA